MEIVQSQRKPAVGDVAPSLSLSLYCSAPSLEVRLEDFTFFTIDRLRVLKWISDGLSRSRKLEEMEKLVSRQSLYMLLALLRVLHWYSLIPIKHTEHIVVTHKALRQPKLSSCRGVGPTQSRTVVIFYDELMCSSPQVSSVVLVAISPDVPM